MYSTWVSSLLQRYGMNFYHNISSGVGYKWFYQTTPLIFQNGGRLYAEGNLPIILKLCHIVQRPTAGQVKGHMRT